MSTLNKFEISFDKLKNARNIAARNLSFTLVELLDWSTAIIKEDVRKKYGERRYQVIGLINNRLHVLVYTPRDSKLHIISFRKANPREVNYYEQKTHNKN